MAGALEGETWDQVVAGVGAEAEAQLVPCVSLHFLGLWSQGSHRWWEWVGTEGALERF